MTGRRQRAAVACALLVLTGCGVSPQPAPEPVPLDRLPSAMAAPSGSAQQVRVWVVRGERVVPVFVERAGRGPRSRVEALLALSTDDETLTSAIPSGTRLLRIVPDGDDVVELQLSPRLLEVRQGDQPLAVAQLVLTATEGPGIRAVRVTAGGRLISVPGASGRMITRPLRRPDVASYVQGPLQ